MHEYRLKIKKPEQFENTRTDGAFKSIQVMPN